MRKQLRGSCSNLAEKFPEQRVTEGVPETLAGGGRAVQEIWLQQSDGRCFYFR